ncbi:MAG: hypothetical protein ACFFFB_11830 [Candidatus Heimdallarchaeota archaeon]
MLYLYRKDFFNTKKLIEEFKFNEALRIVDELEKDQDLTDQEKFDCYYLKACLLLELGPSKSNEILKYIELAYRESQKLKNKLQIIDVLLLKSSFLRGEDVNIAFKIIEKAEQILHTIIQESSIECEVKSAFLALNKGFCYFSLGDLNCSLKYAEEVSTIAKEIKSKELIMQATKLFAATYNLLGKIDLALEYSKYYLAAAEEINNKQEIIGAFNIIGLILSQKGEFTQALGYLEQSLLLCDEISSYKTPYILDSLFDLYININLIEKAQYCLNRIRVFRDQENIRGLDDNYRLKKAILLKKKPQDTNRLKAKEIFKQIIEEEGTFVEFEYLALINLCELFLEELSKTDDLKVLERIHPYVIQIENIAKKQESFWLLAEALLFQAKLKLIIFEFEEAQNLLIKAHNIAEKYGLSRLAKRLINEQYELSNNLAKWEKIKASEAKMLERMNLAQINDQIEILLQKRNYLKKLAMNLNQG